MADSLHTQETAHLAEIKIILSQDAISLLCDVEAGEDIECVIRPREMLTPFGRLQYSPNHDANAVTLFSDGSRLILEEAKGKSLTEERGELVDALTNVVDSLNRSLKGTEETAIILVKLEEARQWLRQMGKI